MNSSPSNRVPFVRVENADRSPMARVLIEGRVNTAPASS